MASRSDNAVVKLRLISFSLAFDTNCSFNSLIVAFRFISFSVTLTCPASIVAMLMISLIMESNCLLLWTIISVYCLRSSGKRSGSFRNSANPTMAFIGVRTSCEMLWRKAVLRRSLSSALSLASIKSSTISFFSVTSRKLQTRPTALPSMIWDCE